MLIRRNTKILKYFIRHVLIVSGGRWEGEGTRQNLGKTSHDRGVASDFLFLGPTNKLSTEGVTVLEGSEDMLPPRKILNPMTSIVHSDKF